MPRSRGASGGTVTSRGRIPSAVWPRVICGNDSQRPTVHRPHLCQQAPEGRLGLSGRRSRVARRRAVGHGLRIGPAEHAPGSRPQAGVRAQLVPCRARAVRCSRWPLGAWRDEGVGAERRPRQWWEWMPHLSARPPVWGRGCTAEEEGLGKPRENRCLALLRKQKYFSELFPNSSPSRVPFPYILSRVVFRDGSPPAGCASKCCAKWSAAPQRFDFPRARLTARDDRRRGLPCEKTLPKPRPSETQLAAAEGGVTLREDFAEISAYRSTARPSGRREGSPMPMCMERTGWISASPLRCDSARPLRARGVFPSCRRRIPTVYITVEGKLREK